MIQRVSETEGEPIVGKFYLVPCANVYGTPIPVIGPWHEDRDLINFIPEHFHRDLRFLSKRNIQNLDGKLYRDSLTSEEQAMTRVVTVRTVRECKMKCKRRMPAFPRVLDWFGKLETAFQDTRLKSCLTCPHRGMPLKNLPQDAEGNVVCNGHGLKFNLKTGRMVSRLDQQ